MDKHFYCNSRILANFEENLTINTTLNRTIHIVAAPFATNAQTELPLNIVIVLFRGVTNLVKNAMVSGLFRHQFVEAANSVGRIVAKNMQHIYRKFFLELAHLASFLGT